MLCDGHVASNVSCDGHGLAMCHVMVMDLQCVM